MGKHSPQMKITRQKAKHKLKFTQNAKPAIIYVAGSVPSSPDSSLGSPNELVKNTDEELDVDLDVVEMTFANPDSVYS